MEAAACGSKHWKKPDWDQDVMDVFWKHANMAIVAYMKRLAGLSAQHIWRPLATAPERLTVAIDR